MHNFREHQNQQLKGPDDYFVMKTLVYL